MNRIALRLLMLVLLIVGTAFISLNIAKGWMLVFHQAGNEPVTSLTELKEPKFEPIQPITLSDVWQTPPTENQAIGTLIIPSLQMNLPVYAGLESVDLLSGAGTMFPERNPQTNNFVIVGHHVGYSELLFGSLGQLENGSRIFLNYLGEDYEYETTKNQVIPETAVSVVDEANRGELTLLTCDKAGATENRIMIKAAQLQKAAISIAENHKVRHHRKIPAKLVWQTAVLSVLFTAFLLIIFSVTKKEQ
ncbi:class A sortase [Enterococcus sp. 669A]|uniref:Class A sortase n=1 Tax=Candidatus Enterococcus moelleringii TaxID=2815325 RepID=A0ABS3LAS5_9ENTE|nr:class A sortase [Enterococcus sp. 669A]MBO1306729.1 class A sortase [Enterococcus sp. 669A]